MLLDTGFPLTVVAIALWKDQREGVTDTTGRADTNAVVRLKIIRTARIKPVGQSESCMVDQPGDSGGRGDDGVSHAGGSSDRGTLVLTGRQAGGPLQISLLKAY